MVNELHVTEARSQQELATTAISPLTAKLFSLAFVAMLVLPFVCQTLGEALSGTLFQEFRALRGLPNRLKLRTFEQDLDNASVLRQFVQPRIQTIVSSAGGFGNEKAVLARAGWIYYAPGLNYVMGAPFLDPEFLRARAKKMVDKDGEANPSTDPTPAPRAPGLDGGLSPVGYSSGPATDSG